MSFLPPRIKAIRHVFLSDHAFSLVEGLAAKRGRNEVGGPMIGYMTVDHALIITEVTGPGPRGECRPASVLIDGAFATAFCEREAQRSGGQLQYVGDWHIHSGDDATPSPTDFKALRKLPRLNAWGYPVVSLVLSSSLGHYVCLHRKGSGYAAIECSVME